MNRIIRFIMLSLILTFTIVLSGCNETANNDIMSSNESPDGKYVAVLFVRDMGATTKESYQLSILGKGQELGNKAGNIFVSYGNFQAEWKSNNELLIKGSKVNQVFKQEKKYKDVNISYILD